MLYPFMILDDQTEIVHSELLSNGEIKVYMERPDQKDVFGFSKTEMDHLLEIVKSTEHLIKEFSKKEGIENADTVVLSYDDREE